MNPLPTGATTLIHGSERRDTARSMIALPMYGQRNLRAGSIALEVDGGAFPEVHSVQSVCAGVADRLKKKPRIDEPTRHRTDVVLTTHKSTFEPELRLDRSESVMDDIKRTANALSFQVTSAQRSRTPSGMVGAPTYFNYTKPSAQNASSRSRVIKLQEAAADPLEPPRHHLRKLPPERVQSTGTLLHSPPRSLTDSEREEWDIPPSISNWKNSKGYTIPLDKRLAADGRGLQTTLINDGFATLSEALYVAEQKSRDAVDLRSKLRTELRTKQDKKNEDTLRKIAADVMSGDRHGG